MCTGDQTLPSGRALVGKGSGSRDYNCDLASETLYLSVGGRKGSGNRAYNVSFPSPRIVGDNTLACIAYGVKSLGKMVAQLLVQLLVGNNSL